jgi:hypothetical protein
MPLLRGSIEDGDAKFPANSLLIPCLGGHHPVFLI